MRELGEEVGRGKTEKRYLCAFFASIFLVVFRTVIRRAFIARRVYRTYIRLSSSLVHVSS